MFHAYFGLSEIESDVKSLHTVLDEVVFNVADPSDDISSKCLSMAKRIGKPSRSSPRMTLVTFESHDDKLKLFKYRDSLRSSGIRISDDLSPFQRQQIKDANTKGYIAYFKNGILCKRPKRNPTSDRPRADGEIRRGVRTLDDL